MRGGWGSFGTPTLRNQGLQPAPDKTSLRTLGKGSPFPSSPTPSYGLTLDWDRDPLSPLSGLSTRNKSEQGSTRHPIPRPILSDKRDCNKPACCVIWRQALSSLAPNERWAE